MILIPGLLHQIYSTVLQWLHCLITISSNLRFKKLETNSIWSIGKSKVPLVHVSNSHLWIQKSVLIFPLTEMESCIFHVLKSVHWSAEMSSNSTSCIKWWRHSQKVGSNKLCTPALCASLRSYNLIFGGELLLLYYEVIRHVKNYLNHQSALNHKLIS